MSGFLFSEVINIISRFTEVILAELLSDIRSQSGNKTSITHIDQHVPPDGKLRELSNQGEMRMRTRISAEILQGDFIRQVETISGQTLLACNQCGKCSAGCQVAFSVDLLPNQVIRLAQLGIEDVLDSETIWACVACLNCVVHCPKGIDLPRVMEALRLINIERSGNQINANDIPLEILSEIPQLAIIGGLRKYTT